MAFMKLKKKNGQIIEIVALLVTFLMIALTIVFGKYILYNVGDAISTSELSTVESNASLLKFQEAYNIFDYSIMFIVFGLTIALIITSFFIDTHPVFLVINIVGLVFLVFLAAVLSNLYGSVIDTYPINETMELGGNDLGNTGFLMQKLPFLCAIIVFITTVVMYAKSRVG